MQDLCLPKDNSMTVFVYEINFSKSFDLWIILCVYSVSLLTQRTLCLWDFDLSNTSNSLENEYYVCICVVLKSTHVYLLCAWFCAFINSEFPRKCFLGNLKFSKLSKASEKSKWNRELKMKIWPLVLIGVESRDCTGKHSYHGRHDYTQACFQ